ncbi:uncharacterized protein LOC124422392 isoform X4 [Vespa crabro]|uniref:uncharacterized protein LOC124422392 isoform X4 n=1 Tax=Vespa crabro TaxID=7445 RepID=UPI001EFFF653|nr:uncharacterized protein LOC124422392 isoform X4 [Vespa crabro]
MNYAHSYCALCVFLMKLNKISNTPCCIFHSGVIYLFSIISQHRCRIFTEHPPEGLLPHHPEMNTAMDMIKLVIPTKRLSSSLPSIYTIIGGGMSEFVAIQEIPNFGLHGYYAISNEPLPLWTQNKTELLKNNENTKKISRFKDSLKYKMLKEINFQQTASQNNHISNETDTKEESERKEISTNETRPCWRTNRYFEKLLDQSPHIATDLEVTTADTLLHILKEKKLDKKEIKNDSCVLSVKKRQFEKMSNFTPSVYESGFDKIQYQSDSEEQLKQNVGIDGINCCRKNNIPSKSFSNIDTKVKYILNKLFAKYKFI